MKLQIDTDNKTIKVDDDVQFSELVEALEKLLPKGLWKDFTLQNERIDWWNNPVIIKERIIENSPYWPSPIWIDTTTNKTPIDPNIVYCSNNMQSGIFNIEC